MSIVRLYSRILTCLLVAFCGVVQASVSEKIPVTIYLDENVPPYSYRHDGQLVGIYPSLIESIVSKIPAYEVNIEALPWTRGLALIENGHNFALSPIYYLPEQRPYIGAYSAPLLSETVSIFCNKSVSDRLDTPVLWTRSFHGLYIAINQGYKLGGDTFWQSVHDGRIKVVEIGKGPQAILQMLQTKRVDCYLHVEQSVKWTANEMLKQGIFQSLDWLVLVKRVDENYAFIGFTENKDKFPFRDNFIELFNQELFKQRKNGLLNRFEPPYIN